MIILIPKLMLIMKIIIMFDNYFFGPWFTIKNSLVLLNIS